MKLWFVRFILACDNIYTIFYNFSWFRRFCGGHWELWRDDATQSLHWIQSEGCSSLHRQFWLLFSRNMVLVLCEQDGKILPPFHPVVTALQQPPPPPTLHPLTVNWYPPQPLTIEMVVPPPKQDKYRSIDEDWM